jgi:N-acetylmuramoyl-L-alanine amidase
VHIGPVVVIDPGHGGTDTGARGTNLVEKDVVLQVAKILRAELERIGYRAVMTRNDDSNPSYEDRAAAANAYRDPIFITLHVSSTGATGNARAYFYEFPVPFQATEATDTSLSSDQPKRGFRTAIPWEEAQRSFSDQSRRLANLVQIELAHRFPQSPNAPTPAAVRNLRSVAAPAVAVEISSVSVSDPIALTSLAGPLAASVARGIAAFRPATPPVTSQP